MAEPAPPSGRQRRVLFLLSSLIVGGSERKTVRLANVLRQRGWEVHIAYIDSPRRSPAPLLEQIDPRIPLRCLGRRRRFSPAAAIRLLRFIKTRGITVVVGVNLHPLCYIAAIAPALRGQPIRWLSLINSTRLKRKRDAMAMRLYRRILRRLDFIVFGCRYQQALWLREYGLDGVASACIYNGTDPAVFDAGQALPPAAAAEPLGRLVVGTVGQLRPEKNQRELLLACAPLLREGLPIRLVLVGEGPQKAALQALAGDLGIAAEVSFPGQLADVRPAVAAMDVFVLSSVTETFSNAALEAMSMGRAVVLSRVGGAAEMVEDGYDGCLYRSGSPDELGATLKRLLTHPAERDRLGANARKTVQTRFSFDRMTQQFENLLAGDPLPPWSGAPSSGQAEPPFESQGAGECSGYK